MTTPTRPVLRVLEGGGSGTPVLVTVRRDDLEELRMENLAARAERVIHTARMREGLRLIMRLLGDRDAHIGMLLDQMERANEQEALRALSMGAPRCACGQSGAGHGGHDEDALDVPVERAA